MAEPGTVTSMGSLLLDHALPEELRKKSYMLDAKGIQDLMREVAEKNPDKYREILQNLSKVGREASWNEGVSVSLSALSRSKAKERVLADARVRIQSLIDNDTLTPKQKNQHIVETLSPLTSQLQDAVLDEAKNENNPFFLQVASGSRGKKSDLNSIRGADLLVSDHNDEPIPIPIFSSYAEGLDPVEYWAGLYGQRKGQIGTKFAVADAGYTGKKLVNAAHRLVITRDQPDPTRLPVGLPVSPTDPDSAGAVLAAPARLKNGDPLPAGTLLTSQHLRQLAEDGVEEIVIHSPLTEPSADGGLSRLAAGRRDRVGLGRIGDAIGVAAAQSISERLAQNTLNSKHQSGIGGAAGVKKSGFDYLNRLIESPENFPEAGPLAEADGVVSAVDSAPQGGRYITVAGHKHYAADGLNPTVKIGDTVESGDDLTDGTPHPEQLVRLRGMGEARRVYTNLFKQGLKDSGIGSQRRNVEAVVAGLLNWGQVTDVDGIGDNIVDDVTSWNKLTHQYKPRADARLAPVRQSVGRYLEEPALHYSIGTRVTKRVADHLGKHGIADLHTHDAAPGFAPYMQRGIMSVHADDDWQTQLGGFYTTSAFQRSVARGASSNPDSTSFIPALAKGVGFGKNLTTKGTYGG